MYKYKHAYTVNIQSIYPRGCVGNTVVIDTESVIIGLCLNSALAYCIHIHRNVIGKGMKPSILSSDMG